MPLFKRAPWEEQFFGLFIEKYTKEDYNYFKFEVRTESHREL